MKIIKRIRLTHSQKLKNISIYLKNPSASYKNIALEYSSHVRSRPHVSTICKIIKNRNSILSMPDSQDKKKREPSLTKLEKNLHEWFLRMEKKGASISDEIILIKAQELKEGMTDLKCTLSKGWLYRWKS